MKRDMDLIREILMFSEKNSSGNQSASVSVEMLKNTDSDSDLYGHIKLMEGAGLVKEAAQAMGYFSVGDLTWYGHDFLDSVRDAEIWRKTKEAAETAGGFTFSLISDIAKGLIKTKVEKHTGVEL